MSVKISSWHKRKATQVCILNNKIILCNSKRQVDLVAAVDVVLRDFKDTDNQLQFSMFVVTNSEAIVPVKVVLKATEVQIAHNN